MNGLPAGFGTLLGASGCTQGCGRRTSLRTLDGSDGPARLVFDSTVLWFRAREGSRGRRSFTVSGAFGAARIVDAAAGVSRPLEPLAVSSWL